ncbi:MAG: winged helix-turn-helix domain-containing protein [Candidatus Thermoplasmatota archaeon]
MMDPINEFGNSAGKIWRVLDKHGPLKKTDIMKHSRLDSHLFHAAVGWLARENKINLDNNTYKLGETNLIGSIGTNAGLVWRALEAWGENDTKNLSLLTQLKDQDLYAALGWLGREDKIIITKDKNKKTLKIRLK